MKTLCLIPAILCLPFLIKAQQHKGDHEIMLGIGKTSGLDIISVIGYNRDATDIRRIYQPIFAASYKYAISDKISLGIGVAQHSYAESWYNTWSHQKISGYYDALSLCAEIKTIYTPARLRYFQLYGTGSLGIIKMLNSSEQYVSLYLCPIALRAGGKNALFMEFGIGYKGLIHAGYSLRLGKKK